MNCPSCGQDNQEGIAACQTCGAGLTAPTNEAIATKDRRFSAGEFVGRQREMDELKAALAETLAGHGRLVMLVGEPGIGKTRTAQELVALATERGALALWGRVREERGAPAYWPWVQVLRTYVEQQDPQDLRSQLGSGAPDIAQIVPEVSEKLPDAPASPRLDDPEAARFRLFESIATFLKNAARRQPLVLVLDNLHWADASSLRFLEFLAQDMEDCRLLILGTYRDVDIARGHPLYHALGELARQRVFQRVLLRGLDQAEVAGMFRSTGEIDPPPELVNLVHRQTEGNPLFVSQVVRLLEQEGLLTAERLADVARWEFRVPEGVREVIGRRLDRLSPECNEALRSASVIGREFDFRLLASLGGSLDEGGMLAALEEALAARLIEEVSGQAERYRFTHALVQGVLVEEVTTTRRIRLHGEIGQVLEQYYGADSQAHAAELAYHFTEAEAVMGTEKLVRYSLLAGERALATYAWEEALAYFERGLAGKEGQPTDAQTADLLFGLGRAQTANLERYRVHEALEQLSQAFDYYVEVGDITQAVAVAEVPVPPPALFTYYIGLERLSSALALVSPDSHEAGRLLSLYGRMKAHTERDYSVADQAFAQALAIARREGDASLEIRTLAAASYEDLYRLRHSECIEKSRRVLELGRKVDDTSAQLLGLYGGVYALCAVGNLGEARQQAVACVAAGEKFGDHFWFAGALLRQVSVSMLEGNWQTAREFSDRALAASELDPRILGKRVLLESETGNWSQGQVFLEQLVEARRLLSPEVMPGAGHSYPAMAIPIAARKSGDLTFLPVAQQAARTVLSSDIATPSHCQLARVGLAVAAVLLGDGTAAQEQYSALSSARGTLITQATMSADRLLGLLAQTVGNGDLAMTHFDEALTFCRNAGYRPELAWTCCDYADTLVERNGPGDHVSAEALLDESLNIAGELGMRPLMERVVSLRERVQPRMLSYPDNLTHREIEVLRLISSGRTNRQIAEELFISLNTVGHHVSNILSKTGTSNRAEVATYAAQRGLTL